MLHMQDPLLPHPSLLLALKGVFLLLLFLFFFFFFFLKRVFKKKDLGLFFDQCSSPSRFFLRKKEMNTKQSQVEKKKLQV